MKYTKMGVFMFCVFCFLTVYSENGDTFGIKNKQTVCLYLNGSVCKNWNNELLIRHPLCGPASEHLLGDKIIVLEAEKFGKNVANFQNAYVYDRLYHVEKHKWFYHCNFQVTTSVKPALYQDLEIPQCRIFHKAGVPRTVDEEILKLKKYTIQGSQKLKRGNVAKFDDGKLFMIAAVNKGLNVYLAWELDEYGRLVHKGLNTVAVLLVEQLCSNDAVQKKLAKLNCPIEFSDDFKDTPITPLRLLDRMSGPNAAERLSLARLQSARNYYGAGNLAPGREAEFMRLTSEFGTSVPPRLVELSFVDIQPTNDSAEGRSSTTSTPTSLAEIQSEQSNFSRVDRPLTCPGVAPVQYTAIPSQILPIRPNSCTFRGKEMPQITVSYTCKKSELMLFANNVTLHYVWTIAGNFGTITGITFSTIHTGRTIRLCV